MRCHSTRSLAALTALALGARAYHIVGESFNFSLTGSTFSIMVDGEEWFGGGDIAVRSAGQRFSVANGNLVAAGDATNFHGKDHYGKYSAVSLSWLAGSAPFVTTFKVISSLAQYQ